MSKEGRLKFGVRGRKVGNVLAHLCNTVCLLRHLLSSPTFKIIPRNQICKHYPGSSFRSKLITCNRISTPRTRYTEKPIDTVPLYGLCRMKEVIAQAFPELVEFGFTDSRVSSLNPLKDVSLCQRKQNSYAGIRTALTMM